MSKAKLIEKKQEPADQTRRDNWEVMKPFVHFSYKALKVLAIALLSIVKAFPLFKVPEREDTEITSRGTTQR